MYYTIVLEPHAREGYTARCVEVPGTVGYGRTKGDAITRIREMIARVQKSRNAELHDIIRSIRSEIIRIEVADPA